MKTRMKTRHHEIISLIDSSRRYRDDMDQTTDQSVIVHFYSFLDCMESECHKFLVFVLPRQGQSGPGTHIVIVTGEIYVRYKTRIKVMEQLKIN